jgi:hypothetical protein
LRQWFGKRELTSFGGVIYRTSRSGGSMADNKDPNQKQPGEKAPGTFHYNPGNQSGKTVKKIINPESEQENNVDRIDEQEVQKRY